MKSIHYLFCIITFSISTYCLCMNAYGKKAAPSTVYNMIQESVINISDSWIEKYGEYDIVRIQQGDLLLEDTETPVVPSITHEIDLPLNAEIKQIGIVPGNLVDMGNINIPAFFPPSPMPDPDGKYPAEGYLKTPERIRVFPEKQYYYKIVENSDYKQVVIQYFPLIFNALTKNAQLYSTAKVKVVFTAHVRGIIKKFSSIGNKYRIGEPVTTKIIVKNLSENETNYLIILEIRDLTGNIVSSNSKIFPIEGSISSTVFLSLKAPRKEGAYRLTMKTFDEMSLVGNFLREVNIIAK